MKNLVFLFILFIGISFGIYGEPKVVDYKTKNNLNQTHRAELLDLLRSKLKREFKEEVKFIVNHFKVSGDYAWFKGVAEKKDGTNFKILEDYSYDCCHVESLFVKQSGKWKILEAHAFSTDVWWEGIETKYPKANLLIFNE